MVSFYKVQTLKKGDEATGFRVESSALVEAELREPGNRLNGVSSLDGQWRVLALRDPLPDYLLDPASYENGEPECFLLTREEAKILTLSWIRTGRNVDPITGEDLGEWTHADDVTAGMPV